MTELSVDVVTDIVCPWCYIGLVRLEAALAASGVAARIAHHPFFLDPDLPPEGVDVAEKLKAKYGGDPAVMFARVEAEARKSGLPLDLSRQPRQRPTDRAHTLIRAAGPKGTQHTLAMALFEAHFMQARNIADPDVLADVAVRHGFSEAEARAVLTDPAELAATREAALGMSASGIGGVPFFIFDRRLALSGAQAETVFVQAIEQAAQAAPTAVA